MKNIVLALAILMTGCASVTKGVNQSLSVTTEPVKHANCTLTNSKGTWYVTTPGNATVHRAYGDMKVVCEKPGFAVAEKNVPSKASVHVAGNLLIPGSIIGAGIDMADGAAYDYPAEIILPMKPVVKIVEKQHVRSNKIASKKNVTAVHTNKATA